TSDELITVDEIGEKIAGSVLNFFADQSGTALIGRLKDAGIQLQSADEAVSETNLLSGKTFVVSGVFTSFTREGLKSVIEANGGKLSGSVSSKTDYVVAGDNMGPEKRRKAESLGVKIITENEFKGMIGV